MPYIFWCILLEVVYEATESGGIPISTLTGNISCDVGCFTSDYDQLVQRDPETLPIYPYDRETTSIVTPDKSCYPNPLAERLVGRLI